jgi:hypothetical protein
MSHIWKNRMCRIVLLDINKLNQETGEGHGIRSFWINRDESITHLPGMYELRATDRALALDA